MKRKLIEADLFKINRIQQKVERKINFAKEYWNMLDNWLHENNPELLLHDLRSGGSAYIKDSTNMFQISLCNFTNPQKYWSRRGQSIYVSVSGRNIPLFDNIWYQRSTTIHMNTQLPIQWGFENTYRYLYVPNYEVDFEDREDWPNQFKWLSDSYSKLLRALIGDISFGDFIWNQMTDEEKERNARYGDGYPPQK